MCESKNIPKKEKEDVKNIWIDDENIKMDYESNKLTWGLD
jgi:hypothetical protein